jgi:hypothetical protein
MIINPFILKPPGDFLLRGVGNLVGAWGLRRIVPGYTGPLCRVLSPDGLPPNLDINQTTSGDFDVAQLENYISTYSVSSARVVLYFDQTGQGRHLSFLGTYNPANRHIIVLGGNIIKVNGHPSALVGGTDQSYHVDIGTPITTDTLTWGQGPVASIDVAGNRHASFTNTDATTGDFDSPTRAILCVKNGTQTNAGVSWFRNLVAGNDVSLGASQNNLRPFISRFNGTQGQAFTSAGAGAPLASSARSYQTSAGGGTATISANGAVLSWSSGGWLPWGRVTSPFGLDDIRGTWSWDSFIYTIEGENTNGTISGGNLGGTFTYTKNTFSIKYINLFEARHEQGRTNIGNHPTTATGDQRFMEAFLTTDALSDDKILEILKNQEERYTPVVPPVEPLYWWDSTDETTMFVERTGASATTRSTVTAKVGTWKSKGSATPIYATTSTINAEPILQERYVNFATNQWLTVGLPASIPQPFTVVDLIRPVSSNDGGWAIHFQSGDVALLRKNATNFPHTFFAGTDLDLFPSTGFGIDYTITAVGDGANSLLRRNTLQAVGNAGTQSLVTDVRFNRNSAANSAFSHRIHQRMIFGKKLTDAEIIMVESFLRDKAGLPWSDSFFGTSLAPQWTKILNQGGATDVLTFNNPGMTWTATQGPITGGFSRIIQPLSGTAWQYILEIDEQTMSDPDTSNTNWPGFFFRNTANDRQYYISLNKFEGLYYVFGARFTGATFNSTIINQAAGISSIPNRYLFRATLASGVITFARSLDGSTWTTLGTETISSWLLAPNQIGIAAPVNAEGETNSALIRGFLRTA